MSIRQIAAQDGCYYSASQATMTTLKPEQPGKVRWVGLNMATSSIYNVAVICRNSAKTALLMSNLYDIRVILIFF